MGLSSPPASSPQPPPRARPPPSWAGARAVQHWRDKGRRLGSGKRGARSNPAKHRVRCGWARKAASAAGGGRKPWPQGHARRHGAIEHETPTACVSVTLFFLLSDFFFPFPNAAKLASICVEPDAVLHALSLVCSCVPDFFLVLVFLNRPFFPPRKIL